jgi:polysaccharide biosynthesis/export protein
LIAGIFLWPSFSSARQEQQEPPILIIKYKIGPRDRLQIKVMQIPELMGVDVRVSEDGSINLPLIGRIMIAGLTIDEVEKSLAKVLEEKYIKNPQVFVFILEYQYQRIIVVGAVNRPGTYPLIERTSLLDILSQAGGIKENAGDEIVVIRKGPSGTRADVLISIEELTVQGNEQMNLPLLPGDIINVRVDKAINFFVIGAVRNPGVYQVLTSKKINIVQALAVAGGVTDFGTYSGMFIKRRMKNGKEYNIVVEFKDIVKGVKPNILLQEGDVIFVKESIF